MMDFQIRKGNYIPLGFSKSDSGVNLAVCAGDRRPLFLVIYEHKSGEIVKRIEIPKEFRFGNVYGIHIDCKNLADYDYNFYQDTLFSDPYGRNVAGCDNWGEHAPRISFADLAGSFVDGNGSISDSMKNDVLPKIPMEEVVSYLIHVRGFTMHSSSKVKHKGTFEGLIEKLPYLKELGINQIELMPVYEFDEQIREIRRSVPSYAMPIAADAVEETNDSDSMQKKATGRINYWGYSDCALYFAPKASYCAGKTPAASFERFMKACHDLDIEVILQFYFTPQIREEMILDVLRYWALRYHVDGFRVMGCAISETVLCQDPFLAGVKLYLEHMPDQMDHAALIVDSFRHVALCQDDFMYSARRFLKSDEDMLSTFSKAMIRNNPCYGIRNSISDYHGFTLQDLVSYERKHNEDNGEDNHDGTDYNFSWNCGFEGKTRKKTVTSLRKKQVNNILTFLFLSAGVPTLRMGDEFGNSQKGNNNAYCQDNEVSWLDWSELAKNRDLHSFVKNLIAFRKAHRIFQTARPYAMVDRTGCGYPDVSFHGTEAWLPEFENYNRHFGMLMVDGGTFLYAAFNMYWTPRTFALPNLPKGMKWMVLMDTQNGFYNEMIPCTDQGSIMVDERSCCILKAVKDED